MKAWQQANCQRKKRKKKENGNAISMLVAVIKTEHNINIKGSRDSSRVPPTLTCQRATYHKAFVKNESFNKWFIHKCIKKKSLTNIWGMRHQTYLFYLNLIEQCLHGKCVIKSLSSFPLHRKTYSYTICLICSKSFHFTSYNSLDFCRLCQTAKLLNVKNKHLQIKYN